MRNVSHFAVALIEKLKNYRGSSVHLFFFLGRTLYHSLEHTRFVPVYDVVSEGIFTTEILQCVRRRDNDPSGSSGDGDNNNIILMLFTAG